MKSKYETMVEPRFDDIKRWVEEGATDKEIMSALGIKKTAFYDYMNKHSDFAKVMREGRTSKITELKNTLFKKAIGFQYQESVEEIEPDGTVRKKVYTKTALPSETAMLILLKHWDKNEDGSPKWANDPATLELKKKELELKKENAEYERW